MILGLIGFGSVARQALEALAGGPASPVATLVCLTRPGAGPRAEAALAPYRGRVAAQIICVEDIADLLAARPAVVAEAAGHGAVRTCADVLAAGVDVIVTSVGALADEELRGALDAAALRGASTCEICSGAVGGLDILAAAKLSGLAEVVYTSRKPPGAWKGTKAETLVDLDALSQPAIFFEGAAREAARDYPQNANVAATIALAGAGFEATRVRLVADPAATRNTHELVVRAGCADFDMTIAGHPSPDNPKTSATTGYALAAHLLRRVSRA